MVRNLIFVRRYAQLREMSFLRMTHRLSENDIELSSGASPIFEGKSAALSGMRWIRRRVKMFVLNMQTRELCIARCCGRDLKEGLFISAIISSYFLSAATWSVMT
jgi:hypothetical protein